MLLCSVIVKSRGARAAVAAIIRTGQDRATVVFRMPAPLSFRAKRGIFRPCGWKTPRFARGDKQLQPANQDIYNGSI